MGLTHFPHGVSSMGVPVMPGGGRFAGWWGKSYFVDYDHGNNGNTGLEPTTAVRDPQVAINLATTNDVIYIRNRDQDITSTDPEYIIPASTTNWSTAEAQTHLSIIGASNVSHIPTQEEHLGVALKGSSTTSSPVFTVNSAFFLLENVAFHRGSSTSGHLLLNGNSTSLRALGSVINNCLFRLDSSTGSYGALRNLDNWFVTVYGCTFHDCKFGVYMVGSNTTIRRVTVDSCLFRNQTAASVDTNITMSGSSSQDIVIKDCIFACNTPTAGEAKFINVTSAATGVVSGCQFPIDTTEGTVSMEINGLDAIACWQAVTTTTGDPTWGLAS